MSLIPNSLENRMLIAVAGTDVIYYNISSTYKLGQIATVPSTSNAYGV